jgi:phosphosulfolactate synthase
MPFLDLPPRPDKPRPHGRTNILDKGLGVHHLKDMLEVTAPYVDLAKLGWGTSMVTPGVREKIATYQAHDIEVCCGGTLYEVVYCQGKEDDYIAWMKDHGITAVEISDGTVSIPTSDKLAAIERFAKDFTVYSEVGSKDAAAIVAPMKWVKAIKEELRAGAKQVLLEGRESGTAGMYRTSGEIRMGLIEEIIEGGIHKHDIVFEAPQKAQQVWLFKYVGNDVNLANIPPEDVISVETLRLGLRGDTVEQFHVDDKKD